MDERQEYAARAMEGLVTRASEALEVGRIAKLAWDIADAMSDEGRRRDAEQAALRG